MGDKDIKHDCTTAISVVHNDMQSRAGKGGTTITDLDY